MFVVVRNDGKLLSKEDGLFVSLDRWRDMRMFRDMEGASLEAERFHRKRTPVRARNLFEVIDRILHVLGPAVEDLGSLMAHSPDSEIVKLGGLIEAKEVIRKVKLERNVARQNESRLRGELIGKDVKPRNYGPEDL